MGAVNTAGIETLFSVTLVESSTLNTDNKGLAVIKNIKYLYKI
jgi:hypothetical protein